MAQSRVRYMTGGGVIIQTGRVLLLDRPARQEIRLPKGHVEPGESPRAAALRETAEEAGYADLRILRDLGASDVEYDYRGRRYQRTEHYFLMGLASGRQATRPAADRNQFRPFWTPFDQGLELLTFQEERWVLEKAVAVWRELPATERKSPLPASTPA